MTAIIRAIVIIAFLFPEATRATSPELFKLLIDLCRSKNVSEAAEKGSRLGWKEVDQLKLDDWRRGFMTHNGGSVDVVGWERGAGSEFLSLSFWVSTGENAHRACAISANDTKNLYDELVTHFGPPTERFAHDLGLVATWKQDRRDLSFSQVGSTATITMSNQ